jgi:hypothetical protein
MQNNLVMQVAHYMGCVLDSLPRGSAITVRGRTKTINVQYLENEFSVMALCYEWDDAIEADELGELRLKQDFLQKIINDANRKRVIYAKDDL